MQFKDEEQLKELAAKNPRMMTAFCYSVIQDE